MVKIIMKTWKEKTLIVGMVLGILIVFFLVVPPGQWMVPQVAGQIMTESGTYYYDQNGIPLENTQSELLVYDIEKNIPLLYGLEKDRYQEKIDRLRQQVGAKINQTSGEIEVYFEYLPTKQSFTVNDYPMYPCSVIKLFVMAATYEWIDEGLLTMKQCLPYLNPMIEISDNTSFNQLLILIGKGSGPKGAKLVTQYCHSLGLDQTVIHHGLLPGAKHFGDGKENKTTPSDVGKLLELIEDHELPYSDEMIRLMEKCEEDSGLPAGLPSDVVCAHKSGWADNYYMDGGIVDETFILVVFTEDAPEDTVEKITSFVYEKVKDF